jgi:signal transduction histidine kinase
VSVEPVRFDLVEELRAVIARSERARPERPVQLDAPESLPIEADRDRVGQVLTNLADNAAKYSPEGGPIRIMAFHDGKEVEIQVADEGVGIPDDLRERVFDLFVQADGDASRRRFGGLGLGLYITRAIVDAHGGRVWAEPNREAGRGTVVHVRLPVVARQRPALSQPSAPGEPPPFVVRRGAQ